MKLHWNVFTTRHPHGAVGKKTEIDTKAPFLHPELPDRVRLLGSHLGLHELGDCSTVQSIALGAGVRVATKHKLAIERAASESPQGCGELHLVLGLREACKILAGKTYKTHVRRAIDGSEAARRDVMFDHAIRLLEPDPDTCETIDPAAYLDPGTWPVESISVRDHDEIFLRLSLIVTAMLCQEHGIESAGYALGDVVLDAVRQRMDLNARVEAELEATASA